MSGNDSDSPSEPADRWTGAQIGDDLSSFVALTSEFYRGEVERTTAWRSRLDQTTNWAVVVVAAILTWAFSSADNPHYVILIGVVAVTAFLVMEATRYREYDIWRDRVRILQEEVFADMYAPDSSRRGADWQTRFGEGLRNPEFNIPFSDALGHRLRRSYFPLFLILLAAWIARITVFEASEPWRQTASIVVVSGEVVVLVVVVFYALLAGLVALSARGQRVREFEE